MNLRCCGAFFPERLVANCGRIVDPYQIALVILFFAEVNQSGAITLSKRNPNLGWIADNPSVDG